MFETSKSIAVDIKGESLVLSHLCYIASAQRVGTCVVLPIPDDIYPYPRASSTFARLSRKLTLYSITSPIYRLDKPIRWCLLSPRPFGPHRAFLMTTHTHGTHAHKSCCSYTSTHSTLYSHPVLFRYRIYVCASVFLLCGVACCTTYGDRIRREDVLCAIRLYDTCVLLYSSCPGRPGPNVSVVPVTYA